MSRLFGFLALALIPLPAFASDSLGISTGSYLLNLGIVAAILLGLWIYSNHLVKSRLNPSGAPQRIKLLERHILDPRRSLLVVEIGKRRWLVGMSEQQFNPIGELSEEDWPEIPTPEAPLAQDKKRWWQIGLGLVLALGFTLPSYAADTALLNTFDLRAPLSSPGMSTPLQLIFVMACLTLLPFLVMMTTSFVRSIIVLSFLRQALGTQGVPPNQVLVGIALFLALFTMSPVWTAINRDALQPYLQHTLTQEQAFTKAVEPLHGFMVRQTNQAELGFFIRLANAPAPETPKDVPIHVLIPAFLVSELATAFKIGFLVYIPFLVIDLVVANTLMALGMSMLPPQMISTAFKILIFTLANGWHLIMQALVQSFR